MKHLYLTTTLLFICTLTFAQKNFQSGYIIQNGDTLRGLVDYRGERPKFSGSYFQAK